MKKYFFLKIKLHVEHILSEKPGLQLQDPFILHAPPLRQVKQPLLSLHPTTKDRKFQNKLIKKYK